MDVPRMFTDEELLENLRSGKNLTESIQFLYRNYFQSLSWFIMNNQGNKEDAENIFQEVIVSFLDAVRKAKYPADASVKIFLFALNKHFWLSELKKRNKTLKRKIKYDKMENKAELDVSEFIMDRDVRSQVFELVDQLDDTCKKILHIFYFQNLSIKEILLDLEYENEKVVRTKKYNCLKQIKDLINATPLLNARLKILFHG